MKWKFHLCSCAFVSFQLNITFRSPHAVLLCMFRVRGPESSGWFSLKGRGFGPTNTACPPHVPGPHTHVPLSVSALATWRSRARECCGPRAQIHGTWGAAFTLMPGFRARVTQARPPDRVSCGTSLGAASWGAGPSTGTELAPGVS